MKRVGFLGGALCLAFLVSATLMGASSTAVTVVTWQEVREEAQKAICPASLGDRTVCEGALASDDLGRAVDVALEKLGPLDVSIPGVFEFPPGDPLDDQWFRAAFLPRLHEALREYGLSCSDCPSEAQALPRQVAWFEFAPYVTVWLEPTPRGFSRCVGIGAFEKLESLGLPADTVLLHAGFIGAMSDTVRERAGHYFREFQRGTYGAGDLEMFKLQLPELLANDPEVEAGVSTALAPFAFDLGISLVPSLFSSPLVGE